jgi:hypothetical protein
MNTATPFPGPVMEYLKLLRAANAIAPTPCNQLYTAATTSGEPRLRLHAARAGTA